VRQPRRLVRSLAAGMLVSLLPAACEFGTATAPRVKVATNLGGQSSNAPGAGGGAGGTGDGAGTTTIAVPPPRRPGADVILAFPDVSRSAVPDRRAMQADFIDDVVPEASSRRAELVIVPLGSEGLTGSVASGVADFSALSGLDPDSAASLRRRLDQTSVDAFEAAFAGPPTDGSDPLGALYMVAELRVEPLFTKSKFLVAELSDGVEDISSPSCDFGLVPLTDASIPTVIGNCEQGEPLNLSGVQVWFLGLGLDLSGQTSTIQALQIRKLWLQIVSQAGGTVTRADTGAGAA